MTKPIIQVPISLGELIDKITILEIKAKHFQGKKRHNVCQELQALEAVLAQLNLHINPQLLGHLKEVNRGLWQIEEAIRQHESRQLFDQRFITLARAVYLQNDRRAALKRRINLDYGSAFIEEKSYQAT